MVKLFTAFFIGNIILFSTSAMYSMEEGIAVESALCTKKRARTEEFDVLCSDITPYQRQVVNIPDENGFTPLMRAVIQKNVTLVEWLLERDADLKLRNKDGMTALDLACQAGDLQLVTLLCKKVDAFASSEELTAPFYSAYGNHETLISFFMNRYTVSGKVKRTESPAIFQTRKTAIKNITLGAMAAKNALLLNKTLPSSLFSQLHEEYLRYAFLIKSKMLLEQLFSFIIKDVARFDECKKACSKLLQEALESRRFGLVATLVNAYNEFFSARYLDKKIGPALLADLWQMSLINPNTQNVTYEVETRETFILMELLKEVVVQDYIKMPSAAIIQLMQKTNAELELAPQTTELMLACIFGDSVMVREIIQLRLPIKYYFMKDKYGRTALMYALLYGNTQCALLLLTADNDHLFLNTVDFQERTALFYAIFSATYDESRIMTKTDGSSMHCSRNDYSQLHGANHVIDILLNMGAQCASTDKTAAQALRLAEQIGDDQVLSKITKNCMEPFRKIA